MVGFHQPPVADHSDMMLLLLNGSDTLNSHADPTDKRKMIKAIHNFYIINSDNNLLPGNVISLIPTFYQGNHIPR